MADTPEISKISVSNTQYDVKDAQSRNRLTAIETGTSNLTKLTTGTSTTTAANDGDANIGGNLNVGGNVTITGELSVSGSSSEIHTQQVYTKKDLIITRDGAVSALGIGEATGIIAEKYDGTNDGALVFDKDGIAKVGDVTSNTVEGVTTYDFSDCQALATRTGFTSAQNGYMPYWDGTNNTFISTLPSFNSISTQGANASKLVTITGITSYIDGMSVKVMFMNGHYGNSFTLAINSLAAKGVYVNKDGTAALMTSHNITRDGDNDPHDWFVQPFTTLELVYVASINSNEGGWMVVGNPVVLSSTTSGYTIYANGWNDTDEYSTSEVKTNKVWIDGKPIYRKVFNIPQFTNKNAPTLSIPDIDKVVLMDGIQKHDSRGLWLTFKETWYFGYVTNGIKLNNVNDNVTTFGMTLVVEYTKTTD